MSKIAQMLQAAAGAAGGAQALAIEDVFSTYLYTGNSSTQTITNGIDLAGEGGMVWIKKRSAFDRHNVYDTERGVYKYLETDTTNPEETETDRLTAFNSDGFSVGSDSRINDSGAATASWTFRKAPRFFDVVTYTGNGSGSDQLIAHNLGVTPGCIIVKRTDGTSDWLVWHRGTAATTDKLYLNRTDAVLSGFGDGIAFVTDERFFAAGTNAATDYHINVAGEQYVAYLFAHDPLGPSGDGSDGLIACGSYTGNGSTNGPEIDLGWEPQWVMIKNATTAANWHINDNMRGMSVNSYAWLYPNLSSAESYTSPATVVSPTATGFKIETTGTVINNSGDNYIYIAIRRGPMRQPESGTEVFAIDTLGSTTPRPPAFKAGFPVDFAIRTSTGSAFNHANTRLLGDKYMPTNSTAAEATQAAVKFDYQDGYLNSTGISSTTLAWMFRRAPGFFDVVAYTGNGVAGRTVPHNLGVAPEMIITKRRSTTGSWVTYHETIGNTAAVYLDSTTAPVTTTSFWNDTSPTASSFSVGTGVTNTNAATIIAYLFATLPGVSKVGSYTGNGSSQTIDCGFTSGARFVLIKRTDSTGDWYVWDTARGIVTGNDPHLSLNTTAAEVTTDDSVDPASSGFIVNQVAATNINVSSASYIFYAVS